jgi:hypothetical protein
MTIHRDLADDDAPPLHADRLRWVACEVCGGSGEIERRPIVGPYEDPTPCAEPCLSCDGTGRDCVEVSPIGMDDLE